jgi:FkbM family methyltransferase
MNGLTRSVRSTIRRLIDRVTLRGDLLAALDRTREELAILRHNHTGTVEGLYALQRTVPGQVAELREQLAAVHDRKFTLRDELAAIRHEPTRPAGAHSHTLTDVGQLAAELATLREAHDRLAADYDRLQRRVRFNSRIDVLNTGVAKLVVFSNDFGYQFTPESSRNYRLSAKDYAPPDWTEQPVEPKTLFRREPYYANVTTLILTHAWANGLDMSVIDIGASYGLECIYTAQFARRCGRTVRIIGFEPGIAGEFTELNARLNHVADMITVVRAAVGNFNGPMLLTGEIGHSENNRIVNPKEDREVVCFPIEVVTLDRYLSEHGIDGPLMVKIDTEGAEPEVIDGMRETLAERIAVLVVEFSPDSVGDRVAPAVFLKRLGDIGTVIDLNQSGPMAMVGDGLRPVPPQEFTAFAEEVRHRSCGWSDVLVIPYNLPDREALLATPCKRPLSQVA